MGELYGGGESGVEESSPPPEIPGLSETDDDADPVEPTDAQDVDDETGDTGVGSLEPREPDEPLEPYEVQEPAETDGEAQEPAEVGGGVDEAAEVRNEAEEPAEAEAGAEDGADDPAEVEDDAEDTAETDAKIAVLEKQGHGPQRHLHPTTEALKDRKGEPKTDADDNVLLKGNGHVKTENHVNPETGKTEDVTPDGKSKAHFCGDYATKFTNPEDYVRAEEYLRDKMIETGDPKVTASIEEIFGPGDHSARFEGYYVDPNSPTAADGSVNHLPVNFEDGYINAVYDRETDGLKTMYPNPEQGRHP
ncbi:hypothetical protein [Streptomyces sp. NPDC001927]